MGVLPGGPEVGATSGCRGGRGRAGGDGTPRARAATVFSAQAHMKRVVTTLGLALLAATASCRGYSADESDGPEQPIAFFHSVHAGQNQMPCMYCHYTADRSVDAGIPSVQLCVGCHVPGSSAPGAVPSQAVLAYPTADRDTMWNRNANLLVDYWKRGEAIPWVRIHKIPEHAKFPHL